MKEIGFGRATAARINKVADVGVARRNHTIEWSVDLLERYQCRVLLYGCLVCFDNCFICIVGTDRVVDVLLGYSVAFQESLIPGFGNGSEIEICLRG